MKQKENATGEIIDQLKNVISQMNDDEYSKPVAILTGNSIGKHIRHIIEFYECLINGYDSGKVDYDLRNRNPEFEERVSSAVSVLNDIGSFMCKANDKPLILVSKCDALDNHLESATSFNRELVYNLEHAVHHMAIIGIALKTSHPHVYMPANFGLAFSTIQYQNEKCAQ